MHTRPTTTETTERRRPRRTLAALTGATLLAGVLAVPAGATPEEVTFEVTVTNTSELGQLDTPRAGGQVPLSPGVWAVHRGGEVLFEPGEEASAGVEDIAEDGVTDVASAHLAATNRVSDHGLLLGAAGPVLAGESVTIEVTARRGDRFSLLTMYVQSNDTFIADDGEGIPLFERGLPVSGDVTDELALWDAGTEVDTAPGTGEFQVLVQDGLDDGPDEGGVIGPASRTGYDYGDVADVIRVTIAPVG